MARLGLHMAKKLSSACLHRRTTFNPSAHWRVSSSPLGKIRVFLKMGFDPVGYKGNQKETLAILWDEIHFVPGRCFIPLGFSA